MMKTVVGTEDSASEKELVMLRLMVSLIILSLASPDGAQRLPVRPGPQNLAVLQGLRPTNPWGSLQPGATLVFQFGDVAAAGVRYVDPARPRNLDVRWDVTKVSGARGVQLQIAGSLFAPGPAQLMQPHQLIDSRSFANPAGQLNLDIVSLAQKVSALAAPSAGRLRASASVRLYIRAVPIGANPGAPAGQPSNVLEAVYGKEPPQANPVQIPTGPTKVMGKPSGILVERIVYELPESRCVVHWSLTPCKIGNFKGGNKDPLIDMVSFVIDVWDWVSKQYGNVKTKMVDVACAVLPMVPRKAFEMGLDAALASCGLPPNIPNLSAAMDGGADYLAGEIVSGVDVPVASDIAKEKIKQAILAGAKEASKHAVAPADTPCDDRMIWKPLLVFVSNLRPTDIQNARVMIMDDNQNFLVYNLTLPRLGRGRMIPVALPMIPNWNRRDFSTGGILNESKWWAANRQPNRVTAWIYEGSKIVASFSTPLPIFDRPISGK